MKTRLRPNLPSALLPALAALGVALLLIVVTALNTQRSLADLVATTASRAQTRMLLVHAERTMSLLKDVETGARGFVITGDESHLVVYRLGLASLPASRTALRAVVSEPWASDLDWPGLDAEIDRRLGLAERLIESRRLRGVIDADQQALINVGKESMDTLRGQLAAVDRRIGQQLVEKDLAVSALRSTAQRAGWLAAGVAVALVLLATALLLRERQARIRLEEELRRANRSLDARVRERTQELSDARDRIAGFAAELERGVEAERRRISREVHDQIGQVLTAIRMIVRGLPADAMPGDQAEVLERAVDMGVTTARRIAAELRPPLLDDLGLQAAVAHFAEGLFKPVGIACEVAIAGDAALGEERALAVFRILQEACSNILRHAEARQVRIDGGREENTFHLTIIDDGRGLPEAIRPGALGIVGMQERAALLGGTVRVDNESGGVRVRVAMPLAVNEEGAPHEDPAA